MNTADNTTASARLNGNGAAQAQAVSFMASSGAAYLAARYGLGVLISLGNMLVLTWWIGPHAYGLFVTAIGMAAFLSTMARMGVDTYLVRRECTPDQNLYAIAGTIVLAVSLGLVLAGALLVPLLVRWFGSREFVAPYLVLLVSVPVTGLTGIPTAKLERELQFRRTAGIELAGQVIGLLVSFALAWAGCGVWAAVAGQTAWQSFLLVAAYASAGMVPRLRFDLAAAREMLAYGAGVTASLRTWQLRTLVNPLLVGRFAGAEGVAFVALAIRIAEALGSVRLAAGRVAIASLSRLQIDTETLGRTLERSLYLQVMLLGPLLSGFALLGPLFFHHVIGSRWTPSLAIYPFVAAGVLVNSVYNLQASALFVRGEASVVTRSYISHVLLLSLGTYMLLPRLGIAAYGWAELLACAGYTVIHRAFLGVIRYAKLAPCVVFFAGVIFLPLASRNRVCLLLVSGMTSAALLTSLRTQRGTRLARFFRRARNSLNPATGILALLVLATGLVAGSESSIGAERRLVNASPSDEIIPPELFGMHFRLDKLGWPSVPFGALRLWDTDTNWQKMNPQPGRFDFSVLDRYLATAHRHGMADVMLTLGGTPAWASANPNDRSCDYATFSPGSCHPPTDLNADGSGSNKAWRDFLYALGMHLAALDPKQYAAVNYFSVWNEFTRGRESRHASWLGTNEQLRRMVADANCILLGRGASLFCTPLNMHEPAVRLLPSAGMTTPDAVPLSPGLERFAEYLNSKDQVTSVDVIAVHAYAYDGMTKTFPDRGRYGLPEQWSDIQRIAPSHSLPVWSTESGWGDTRLNLPDSDLQIGYIARYYLVGWSLGFRRLYWYASDNSWGRLIYQNAVGGCRDHGTHMGCPAAAAFAWTQTYHWMVGNRMTRPCAPGPTSIIWTCELLKPDGSKLLAVWDASKSCSHGACETSRYTYPSEFGGYFSLDDDRCRHLTGGTVPVSWKPVLLCHRCADDPADILSHGKPWQSLPSVAFHP